MIIKQILDMTQNKKNRKIDKPLKVKKIIDTVDRDKEGNIVATGYDIIWEDE